MDSLVLVLTHFARQLSKSFSAQSTLMVNISNSAFIAISIRVSVVQRDMLILSPLIQGQAQRSLSDLSRRKHLKRLTFNLSRGRVNCTSSDCWLALTLRLLCRKMGTKL